jgi:hypothetical protein
MNALMRILRRIGLERRPAWDLSKFERWMMAVTFAEAGDRKTALDITGKVPRRTSQKQNRRKIQSRIDHRPRPVA